MPSFVVNQIIKGRKGTYEVVEALTRTVFKAHIRGTCSPVILKVPEHPVPYNREVRCYTVESIAKSPHIRALREVIDDGDTRCMVLEWMDTDLTSVKAQCYRSGSHLPKIVAKAVLEALAVFKNLDGQTEAVHTDVNPNNILLSGLDGPVQTVKLSDLGNLIRAGPRDETIQGTTIRAPEIWRGENPSPACDVWSLGVSLAHWLASKTLFGANDMNIMIPDISRETTEAAWCIAKIARLRKPIPKPTREGYSEHFILADLLVQENFIKIGSLRQELKRFAVDSDCIAFIEYLLQVNPTDRPTAADALRHPWLKSVTTEHTVPLPLKDVSPKSRFTSLSSVMRGIRSIC